MVTIRVTKRYRDIELSTEDIPAYFEIGDTREVTDKRAKELVAAGVAEILSITREKKETKTKTQKATKKNTKETTKKSKKV